MFVDISAFYDLKLGEYSLPFVRAIIKLEINVLPLPDFPHNNKLVPLLVYYDAWLSLNRCVANHSNNCSNFIL